MSFLFNCFFHSNLWALFSWLGHAPVIFCSEEAPLGRQGRWEGQGRQGNMRERLPLLELTSLVVSLTLIQVLTNQNTIQSP